MIYNKIFEINLRAQGKEADKWGQELMTKCVYFFLRESENLMTMTIKCLLTDIECSVDTNKSQNEHIFKYKNAWEK